MVFPHWVLWISSKHFDQYMRFGKTYRPKTWKSVLFIYFQSGHNFLTLSTEWFSIYYYFFLFTAWQWKRSIHSSWPPEIVNYKFSAKFSLWHPRIPTSPRSRFPAFPSPKSPRPRPRPCVPESHVPASTRLKSHCVACVHPLKKTWGGNCPRRGFRSSVN